MKEFSTFMINFDKLLRNDENLLRLLYYPAKNFSDDIFEVTDARKRITPPPGELNPAPTDTYVGGVISNKLRHSLIYSTIKVQDLQMNKPDTVLTVNGIAYPSSRLIFYMGNRTPNSNYQYPFQEVVIDIYVHTSVDALDYRLSKLCDYVTELVDGKRIAGIGVAEARGGNPNPLSAEYIGYRLYFRFGSERS
jgi:hypothetical protein